MTSPFTVAAFDVPKPGLAALIEAGLDQYNEAFGERGAFDGQGELSSAAYDAGGRVIGGAVGRTLGRCCELQQLWVDATHRQAGVGSAVVRAFEQRARERGCDTCYLSTFSFRARPFYERLGYAVQLEIPGHGAAGSKFFMVKKLAG
ncbi:GNAT family N-acetyltransferase [Mitsuaria sp. GD03876]|uniref:GNAT family N-acetyltransferase n=1 Tax=Mitsuaria sp. GD03876 TaxID=2975399 RepID=UPI00244C3D31|nr:GNAT family N-acetyltransferase [Mitsuaria sp. GD03876]MDH0863299.1 GNAT family N-acetyltransferase [Mitsuaria sp. GD03876]